MPATAFGLRSGAMETCSIGSMDPIYSCMFAQRKTAVPTMRNHDGATIFATIAITIAMIVESIDQGARGPK